MVKLVMVAPRNEDEASVEVPRMLSLAIDGMSRGQLLDIVSAVAGTVFANEWARQVGHPAHDNARALETILDVFPVAIEVK